jgi:hypothetical protein
MPPEVVRPVPADRRNEPRRFVRALIAVMGLTVAFGAGAIVAIARGWGAPGVVVDIVNATDQPIASIELIVDTCGARTRITGEGIASNASRRLEFVVCGEAGYRLRVAFSDGREIANGEGYVERGYRVSERVERERIVPVVEAYRL